MTRQRRLRGDGTVFRRADGRWEARLTLRNGKRKAFTGADQKTVRGKLDAARADLKNAVSPGNDRLTLRAFAAEWLASVEKRVGPRTFVHYSDLLDRHVLPDLGGIRLREITVTDIDRLLTAKLNEKKDGKRRLSPRTVSHIRSVLRAALSDAKKKRYVSDNVAGLSDEVKVRPYEGHVVTAHEAVEIIEAVRGDRIGPLVVTMLATGARPGELFGLRWQDADLPERTVSIRQVVTRVRGKALIDEPKSKLSRRELDVPEIVVDALHEQRRYQAEDRLLAGRQWQDNDLVFATSIGTPLDGGRVLGRYKALIVAAGLPPMRLYDLRHAFASLQGRSGTSMKVVSEAMGHSSIKLTADTYTHVFREQHREAADRMDALLAPKELRGVG